MIRPKKNLPQRFLKKKYISVDGKFVFIQQHENLTQHPKNDNLNREMNELPDELEPKCDADIQPSGLLC